MLPTSEASLKQAAAAWQQQLHLDPTSRVLSCLKPGSVAGLSAVWSSLAAGSTLIAPGERDQLLQKLCTSRTTVLTCEVADLEAACDSWSAPSGHGRPNQLSAVCLQDRRVLVTKATAELSSFKDSATPPSVSFRTLWRDIRFCWREQGRGRYLHAGVDHCLASQLAGLVAANSGPSACRLLTGRHVRSGTNMNGLHHGAQTM